MGIRHCNNLLSLWAEQAAEVEALLRRENKDMEISVIDGGQPVYYYILSVE